MDNVVIEEVIEIRLHLKSAGKSNWGWHRR
jgi:hypothetical protein